MDAKPFWQSKTFWVNLSALIIAIGQQYVNPELMPTEGDLSAIVLSIVNLILRFVTKSQVTLK